MDDNRGKIKNAVVDPISGELSGRCSGCYIFRSIFSLHYVNGMYRCKDVEACKHWRFYQQALSINSW